MSTLPPNPRGVMSRTASVNMAVAQPVVKSKAPSKATSNANQKAKTQMHRRSRTGWLLPISTSYSLAFQLILGPPTYTQLARVSRTEYNEPHC